MKKYFSSAVAIALAAVFTACSSVKTVSLVESGNFTFPESEIQYDSISLAVENFDYEYLRNEGSPKYLHLAEIFELINKNEYDKAIEIIIPQSTTETDPQLLKIYSALLYELYFSRNDWGGIISIQDTITGAITYKAFANTYINVPPETITFSNRITAVPFETSKSGTPIVEVTINGYKARFFVDTGAGMTVVSSDVAEACGLIPLGDQDIEAQAATAQNIGINAASISDLRFGGINVKNHPAIIIDSENLKFKLLGIFTIVNIEGIIGWNLLQKMGITIDYRNSQIEFYDAGTNPKNHSGNNMFWLGYPVVKLRSGDGSGVLFGLDTGANTSSIREKIINRFSLSYSEHEITLGSAGGFVDIMAKKVDSLKLFLNSGKSILFKDIDTHPLEPASVITLDGILGSDLFDECVVEIDFPNNYFNILKPGDKN